MGRTSAWREALTHFFSSSSAPQRLCGRTHRQGPGMGGTIEKREALTYSFSFPLRLAEGPERLGLADSREACTLVP